MPTRFPNRQECSTCGFEYNREDLQCRDCCKKAHNTSVAIMKAALLERITQISGVGVLVMSDLESAIDEVLR